MTKKSLGNVTVKRLKVKHHELGHVFTLVDSDLFASLNGLPWQCERRKGKVVSIQRLEPTKDGKRKNIKLSRQIMNAPQGVEVDHINRDPLDNRRENLRLATRSQNNTNRDVCGKSGYKGVYLIDYKNKTNPWLACLWRGNKRSYLGVFKTKEEAAAAYNRAAIKEFGEFACLNKLPLPPALRA